MEALILQSVPDAFYAPDECVCVPAYAKDASGVIVYRNSLAHQSMPRDVRTDRLPTPEREYTLYSANHAHSAMTAILPILAGRGRFYDAFPLADAMRSWTRAVAKTLDADVLASIEIKTEVQTCLRADAAALFTALTVLYGYMVLVARNRPAHLCVQSTPDEVRLCVTGAESGDAPTKEERFICALLGTLFHHAGGFITHGREDVIVSFARASGGAPLHAKSGRAIAVLTETVIRQLL